ncbi:uncharacterized protein [Drosophila kikkawai]|uniref:LITAF domain-containing protein n=1 Tax=Drosophila kikkawai TaxID=30033 RepID=A0A6P4INU1_DROKI|nr:uncharacterized protein LOC108080063 [Drosophila kikkawai]
MEEEKHRMLYQGMDPSQASPRPISQSPSEPPTYDDAMATEPPLAHLGFPADRRRTFFAEPQHLRYRLEEMPYLVSEQPQLQVVPELPEEAELQEEPEMQELPLENPNPERREQRILEHPAPVHNFFELTPQPKLGSRALEIMCPACGQQGVTSVRRTAHTRTHVSALLLCTFGWCCCACLWPYLLKGCRITRHYCSVCEIFLGAHYPRGCCG